MPPKQHDPEDTYEGKDFSNASNNDLVEGAGEVHMDEGVLYGKAIIQEFRDTVGKYWVKEMTNFNQKTVAVTFLLFISVIAPTLTFGAVYGKVTNNYVGAVEVILATCWVGIAYSLMGGMPVCIIGSTGPVVAFTRAVQNMSNSMDVPYLTFNAWISIWLMGYAFLSGFFDGTRIVRMCTRFTDEIFALLIVSIFVLDAIGDPFSPTGIIRYFDPNHKSHEEYNDDENYDYMQVALLSVILGFGTTALIFFFRTFKFSSFFCHDSIRTSIHDFSVTLTVVIATLVKEFLFSDIQTEQLNVPSRFEPTFQCCDDTCRTFFPDDCLDQDAPTRARSWFVDLSDTNGKAWVPIAAAGPAILAFLLVYLDSGITWHLINHKSHNLKHGEAYNYDLCLLGIFNCVNGLLGLPWLVGTTVPCIIHLHALAEKDKDGKFVSVQETRLTHFFAHLMVGLSLLFLEVLQLLPMPVLYGVFLFMGLSSLPGLQFYQRFLYFFMQPSKYPKNHFTTYMSKKKIHLYTCIEVIGFFCVFTVQNFAAISIIFPFLTLLMIPTRNYLLPRFFEGWELLLLDGDNEDIDAWVAAKEGAITTIRFGNDDGEGEEEEEEVEAY